jgi:hypothetical protein
MSTFARAAHQVDPPDPLKERVLAALEEERSETAPRRRRIPGRPLQWTAAAAIVALAGALAWTGVAAVRASDEASKYREFLSALGGKDVRVGVLNARGEQQVDGSVVMYDSDHGQSWVLVLVHAPGESGEARVMIQSPKRQIELRPLEFDPGGEGSTWLVTASNVSRFDRVKILDPSGRMLASGRVSHE